ncbi:serine protease [Streptomyces sp. SID2999]|uniref:SSI family serine proteinase inhibitor n=1 Tax=Streptomyces sp. SID2999 TaxID=2690258 RepID=UPI0013721FE8|nr:SSI family serine proteinase inhibitor [Streptomyces sp. SID2999]MYZ10430.1 serine protease [Streptomyces sp. SID2999]
MNRLTRTAALAATLMATCLLAPGTTAHAASGDWLSLTVTRPGTTGGGTRAALLLCDPPQGHPKAAEACAELIAAEGDFGRLGDRDTLCPLIYAPVRASAQGSWHGKRIDFERTYGNACEMGAETGSVFALEG